MPDINWPALVNDIRKGACTPFIGAGACDPTLPPADKFALALISDWRDQTGQSCPLPPEQQANLRQVAQFLAVREGPGYKDRIARLIARAGPPDFCDALEPHVFLARQEELPLYLTTNYDNFMTLALERERKRERGRKLEREQEEVVPEFARWCWLDDERETIPSDFDENTYCLRPSEPVVFHFHGHAYSKEAVQAIVASEDDYVDFLVNVSKDIATRPARAILPLQILRAIRNTKLLFVGYSLKDIDLRMLFRALLGPLPRSRRRFHVVVQLPPGTGKELRDYLEEYFYEMLDLSVYWGTVRDFIRELGERMKEHGVATCC
jgi:hypothetical protein